MPFIHLPTEIDAHLYNNKCMMACKEFLRWTKKNAQHNFMELIITMSQPCLLVVTIITMSQPCFISVRFGQLCTLCALERVLMENFFICRHFNPLVPELFFFFFSFLRLNLR